MMKGGQLAEFVGLGVWCLHGKLHLATLSVFLEGGGIGGPERGEGI